GCPVNGPVLALDGEVVAAAWFTRADDDVGRVRVAFSRDGGASFGAPLELARAGVVGSLTGAFDAAGVFRVAWLAHGSDGTDARGWWVLGGAHPERGIVGAALELVEALPARIAGIARLAQHAGALWFAWTEVTRDGATRVRCARVAPPGT
ncbi:MAG TPA: hypothetical protein VMT18_05305, partial [Planctomycetota bacterium]|nr:hypothetical protein [Planctomycetota bacterium]